MHTETLDYYNGDFLPAEVWEGKYRSVLESSPDEMHERMARELAKAENRYGGGISPEKFDKLSDFGKRLAYPISKEAINVYLKKYKYIIPQGSIMSGLGTAKAVSLSNCFVIPAPEDSYGGIFRADQEIAQLEKRRGGVGLNLNTLRPEDSHVSNAAGSSTGAHNFMSRYSSTTREVAQNGRRGALMLLMDCRHPDIFKFVTKKQDRTQVTGANISVMLTDKFMKAVESDSDFRCQFPIDADISAWNGYEFWDSMPYNVPEDHSFTRGKNDKECTLMKIKAKELYDTIVEMAWDNAEPGVAFIDRVKEYCPEGVYPQFVPVASNPCGEQWMQAYDACRLLCLNFYNIVESHFTTDSKINYDLLYDIAYMQQRLADDIVDLEIEYVERIIDKIKKDPEPEHIKATELNLWMNIKKVASESRRTGCGFTALADMLASLNLKYDSEEALEVVKEVMKTKMRAELDCTIDLAILRGPFVGWNSSLEFHIVSDPNGIEPSYWAGSNLFYKMIAKEFPEQAARMRKHGRRNVSWSTVAPTGSVSIVALLKKWANTSAGVEPQFATHYYRNKKVNPGDKDVRVDFVDQNGDSWMTYPVIMGGLKEYIDVHHKEAVFVGLDNLPKEVIEEIYKKSPYYKSCANDISWEKRIEIQAVVQRYTTNAISSTLNLPKDVSKETVSNIYQKAWEAGLKGVTVYRDGCRTGVLNKEVKKEEFVHRDAPKRPKELEADLYITTVKGTKYAVVVGLLDDKPYEMFAMEADKQMASVGNLEGKIVKVKKGHYNFVNGNKDHLIKDINFLSAVGEQTALTRLVSGMLRHGAKPDWVATQIDKCELEVVSFGKAMSRILRKYCPEEEAIGEKCENCGCETLVKQEGCIKCTNCGASKCG